MTVPRAASWLVGMVVVLTVAALVRAGPSSTWAGRSDHLLWWIDVLAGTALVTSSVICKRLTVPVLTWARA